MPVPLSRPPVDDEIKAAVLAAIDSRQYILGPECQRLRAGVRRATTARKHAVLTSSATAALWMTLKAFGVKAGDEVLVPSHTAFPTVEAICFAGATPVFVDVDDSYTVDLDGRRRQGDAAHGGLRARAPLRPSRGSRRHPAALRRAQPLAARGLRAGARGRLAGAQGRQLRARRRVLVLPVEEPHRDGRRRASWSPTTTTWPRAAGGSATTAGSTRTSTPRSASTCASTTSRPRSGACCCAGSTR